MMYRRCQVWNWKEITDIVIGQVDIKLSRKELKMGQLGKRRTFSLSSGGEITVTFRKSSAY